MTLRDEVLHLKGIVTELQAEVRLLRRGNLRADADSIETLLEYLHDVFALAPWTSSQVFERAEENPLLYAALVRCLGPQPTIQRLSKLVMRYRGPCGAYSLKCLKERGRLGAVFTVTHSVTASQIQKSTVTRTTSRRSL
jgi:hypothetical protein